MSRSCGALLGRVNLDAGKILGGESVGACEGNGLVDGL